MLRFKIERDADEYHAWCPELKGCHTHGATRQEALDNLKEAVALYVGELIDSGMVDEEPTSASAAQ